MAAAFSSCIRTRMFSSRPLRCAFRVPDAVPTHRAVLAANMETALNVVWDAAPLAGERMLVIGAGVVGLLAASLLARFPAARVTVVDIDPAREAAGAALRLRLRHAGDRRRASRN